MKKRTSPPKGKPSEKAKSKGARVAILKKSTVRDLTAGADTRVVGGGGCFKTGRP
jgi:hypothetical protein